MSSARDNLMFWKTARKFIGVREMLGFDNTGTADTSLSQGTSVLAKGTYNAEIVTMTVAEADEIHTVIPIPWDLDRNQKVLGRLYFIHEAAAADTGLVWKVGTLFFAKQAGMAEIQGGADTTTTFTAHTVGSTAASLEVTVWNDLSWDDYITTSDILAGLAIEFDTNGDCEDDECNLIGIELMYQRKATQEFPGNVDADLLSNPI